MIELLEAGWNRLAPPTDVSNVKFAINEALSTEGKPIQPYGVGDLAQRIITTLIDRLN